MTNCGDLHEISFVREPNAKRIIDSFSWGPPDRPMKSGMRNGWGAQTETENRRVREANSGCLGPKKMS